MDPERQRLRWDVVRLLQDVTVASDRFVDSEAKRAGMHRTDLHALSAIVRHDDASEPLTVSELAHRLDLSAPATTALVDRLEANGHVTRARSEADRRRVILRTTRTARETGGRIFTPLAVSMAGVTDAFDAVELAAIARFLDASAEAITQVSEGAQRDPRAVPRDAPNNPSANKHA